MPSDRVNVTLEATCADLGFGAPPATVRMKLLKAGAWSLWTQAPPGVTCGRIADWLETLDPVCVDIGRRRVIRADFHPVPRWLATRFDGIDVPRMFLRDDDSATLDVVGERAAVRRFSSSLDRPDHHPKVLHVAHATVSGSLLTAAQDEAVRAAVTAGYYRIPRPLNLHALARRLGVSAASLSERLRRAEGRIISGFVEGGPTLEVSRPFLDVEREADASPT